MFLSTKIMIKADVENLTNSIYRGLNFSELFLMSTNEPTDKLTDNIISTEIMTKSYIESFKEFHLQRTE